MTYATELVHHYRLALRELWNTYLWPHQQSLGLELSHRFREIRLPLYTLIMADRLEPLGETPTRIFGPAFKVVPKPARGLITNPTVNREPSGSPGAGMWDIVKENFTAAQLQASLIDFFDSDHANYMDLRYYRVLVEACDSHPEFVGREALIDVLDADVIWNPC
jgi:hypothetical protein